MSFLSKLSNSIVSAFELSGRAKTLSSLNAMSNSQLEDLGFSRELMAQGISAYPWKVQDFNSMPTLTETRATSKEVKDSIKELQAYNDRDLADIGISRHEIEEVVLNGRHNDKTRAA